MTEERKTELLKYKACVSVFRKWLENRLISKEDYEKIESDLAAKYRLSLCSIWREKP